MKNENNLPMKWWNFCKYFRFPISIIVSIISLLTICNTVSDIEFNWLSIVLVFVPVIYILFQIIVYINFIKKTKIGYKLVISSLFIEAIINSILNSIGSNFTQFTQSFIIYSSIWALIFVYPSYIYFSKRKYVFEQNSQISLKHNKTSDNNITESTQQSSNTSWQEYLDKNFNSTGTNAEPSTYNKKAKHMQS